MIKTSNVWGHRNWNTQIDDINKVIVSNKAPFGKKGFKYLIGYKGDKKN